MKIIDVSFSTSYAYFLVTFVYIHLQDLTVPDHLFTLTRLTSVRVTTFYILESIYSYHTVGMENLTDISEPQVLPNKQKDQ